MKHRYSTHYHVSAILGLAFCAVSQVFGQGLDQEPNNTCLDAQHIGPIVAPYTIDGSLDTPPDRPDVDFFRFTMTPGTHLIADLVAISSLDPYLGLLDSNCNVLDSNDDFDYYNSRLSFTVPADGQFVLAASSCCDGGLEGFGGSSGEYQLAIIPPPPSVASITGVVVDAISGDSLAGDASPYAYVELMRCEAGDCFYYLNSKNTNGDGSFEFTRDGSNQLLPVGTYNIRASANEYQSAETGPFDVGVVGLDIGEIALMPPPIVFSDIQPCDDLPAQGGRCHYSFRIDNNTASKLRGLVWSLVDANGLGSSLDFATFEASRRRGDRTVRRERVQAKPFSSDVVSFQFDVPSYVRDGASFCTRVFFGLEPDPLVNTVSEGYLFCMTKGSTGFQVLSASESQKAFRSLGAGSALRKNLPAK